MSGRLIVVSGLPGVGKSEAARRVAAALRAVHLSIDPVRAAAESNLSLGLTVVVEAVNDSEPARETWRRAAASTDAPVHWVMITCSDPDEHRRRLEGRERGLSFIVESPWDDVRERADGYAPWTDLLLRVDSAGRSPDDVAEEILDALS